MLKSFSYDPFELDCIESGELWSHTLTWSREKNIYVTCISYFRRKEIRLLLSLLKTFWRKILKKAYFKVKKSSSSLLTLDVLYLLDANTTQRLTFMWETFWDFRFRYTRIFCNYNSTLKFKLSYKTEIIGSIQNWLTIISCIFLIKNDVTKYTSRVSWMKERYKGRCKKKPNLFGTKSQINTFFFTPSLRRDIIWIAILNWIIWWIYQS